jgi:uncharacterized membrane protein
MDFSVNGLPLHPLLVHSVIALVPITALAVVLHALWPAARRRLGIVTPLAGLALLIAVPLTVAAGEDLQTQVGPIPAVARHSELGHMLLPWAVALFVLAAAEWVWFRWRERLTRSVRVRRLVSVVLAVLGCGVAAGALVLIVLIGDSGARAVWGA